MRWTLEWEDAKSHQLISPATFIKLHNLPQLVYQESRVFDGDVLVKWPAKPHWEEITVNYLDVKNDECGALFMYWVSQQFQRELNKPPELALATLNLYDPCGEVIETWILYNAIVTSINFGSFDYIDSEVTVRYSHVEKR